jgi:hypothetical protein
MNNGVVVVNGVGKWLSIRGVSFSTNGTFQLNNASTFTVPMAQHSECDECRIYVRVDILYTYKTNIYCATKGVEVVAGGTWDQVGDVSLVVPSTAPDELVGVTLDNATWVQRGDFDCTFQQWSGVHLKGDHATWHQHGQASFTSTNAGYISRAGMQPILGFRDVMILLTNNDLAGITIGALQTALWNQTESVTFNMQGEQLSGRCATPSYFHLFYNRVHPSAPRY